MTTQETFSMKWGSATIVYIKITPEEAKKIGWCQDWIPFSDILNALMGVTEEDKKNSPPFIINKDYDHPIVGEPFFEPGCDSLDLEIIRESPHFFGKVIEVREK